MDTIVNTTLRAALCSLAFFSSPAIAGTIGTATINDVTLGGASATVLSYGNGINPQSKGPRGGSTGFNTAFSSYGSGDWTRLAAFGVNADDGAALSSVALGSSLTLTFDKTNGRNGAWTLTNNDALNDVELDLVFAIHTGGGSGAWMFDEQTIGAGQTLSGSWALNLRNNGGNFSGYSNLTVFGRNLDATPAKAKDPIDPPKDVGPIDPPKDGGPIDPPKDGGPIDPPKGGDTVPTGEVPEPGTWAMFLLGLAALGMARRKRAST